MSAIISLKINVNPIKEQDVYLYVLASRGILTYCQTADAKRFYLLASTQYVFQFHFIPEGFDQREKIFNIQYIAQASRPGGSALRGITYPMPVTVEDAGREKWFSMQTGGKTEPGDLTIKSDKSGQITYLMGNTENRALALWRRNPKRIKDFAAAMEYLGHVNINTAKIAARPKSAGTGIKAIQRIERESEIERRIQEKLRQEVISEMQ